ncbi:hypothetical protein ACOXXX_21550 [Thalassococcus sp. BH17M4-6]|uniref:hypothetical protein n=1 Tax=Thalassococcus sp. BH17M4-6 TaxID=3413148 RepID=UPI003BE784A6
MENILIDAGVTDFSELGALSSSMIFYPSASDKKARLVDLGSFLRNTFEVKIFCDTQTEGEIPRSPRIFVPFDFARSFLLSPESMRREGCNAIDFRIDHDGLFITYRKYDEPLTEVTKRGTFQ